MKKKQLDYDFTIEGELPIYNSSIEELKDEEKRDIRLGERKTIHPIFPLKGRFADKYGLL